MTAVATDKVIEVTWPADQVGLLHYHATVALGDEDISAKSLGGPFLNFAKVRWRGLAIHVMWMEWKDLDSDGLRSLIRRRFGQAREDAA